MIRGLFFSISFVLSTGIAIAQVGTPIPSGQTVTINAHGQCRKVTNPGSGTRMVFTGTATEWQSFRNNPNGLSMAACCTRQPASGWYGNSNYEWYADQTSDDDDDYYSQHLRWSGSTVWSRGGRERDREDLPLQITIGGWTYYRGSVYSEGMRTGGRYYHYRIYRERCS